MSSTSDADTLPGIDERIVMPESGYEIDDGKLVRVPPAEPPHAEAHFHATVLVGGHLAPPFKASVDMLMRVSENTDMAPDISVFPRARNAETGGRLIEELVFEIAGSQSLGLVASRLRRFIARGVRRGFTIHIERGVVLEWVGEHWVEIDMAIADPVFAMPLPVRALLDTVSADDDLARALIAKRNHVFSEELERVKSSAGKDATGVATALLLKLLAARGIAVTAEHHTRIAGASLDQLQRWLDVVDTCTSADELT